MKSRIVMGAALLMMANGAAIAENAENDLQLLSSAANAYAVNNLTALYKGADVHDRVVVIPHGAAYGQSLHPATDGLKAMAYLPQSAVGGDVTLEFNPPSCNTTGLGACNLMVHATVSGMRRTHIIRAR